MDQLLERLCDLVERHGPEPRQSTAVPGLTLFRVAQATHPAHYLYNPRILVVLRGSKTVHLGDAPFQIDPKTFLLVTVDLPVASQIFPSDDGKPHLALTLDIDRPLLADFSQHLDLTPAASDAPAGAVAAGMTRELLDAFSRLLTLLDQPGDSAFLSPLIMREIYFRLHRAGLGETLAQLASSGSHLSQISKTTNWIKSHYNQPMSIDDLAAIAGMSVTSFHRHFKAVTMMTPLQYRTQFRLLEARRLLLAERQTAGAVGVSVGYDNQSQFCRDYKRMFGAPPATDAGRMIASGLTA